MGPLTAGNPWKGYQLHDLWMVRINLLDLFSLDAHRYFTPRDEYIIVKDGFDSLHTLEEVLLVRDEPERRTQRRVLRETERFAEDLKKQYKQLSKEVHPDVMMSLPQELQEQGQELFKEINKYYEILTLDENIVEIPFLSRNKVSIYTSLSRYILNLQSNLDTKPPPCKTALNGFLTEKEDRKRKEEKKKEEERLTEVSELQGKLKEAREDIYRLNEHIKTHVQFGDKAREQVALLERRMEEEKGKSATLSAHLQECLEELAAYHRLGSVEEIVRYLADRKQKNADRLLRNENLLREYEAFARFLKAREGGAKSKLAALVEKLEKVSGE